MKNVALMALLSVTVLASAGCDRGKEVHFADANKAKNPANSKSGLSLTAQELHKRFKQGDPDAEKTIGSFLEVEGVVQDPLVTDLSGLEAFLFLSASDREAGAVPLVRCVILPEQRSEAEALWRGQRVKIRGQCAGCPRSTVELIDCRVVESGEAVPVLAVSAGQMIKAYHADAAAADQTYKGKAVEVEGVIAKLGTGGSFEESYLTLKGDGPEQPDPIRIFCRYVKGQRTQVESFQEGQHIKVKAECDGKGSSKDIELSYMRIVKEK
jgi:hypothetical protein